MSKESATLDLRSLYARYDDVYVVQNVSLEVRAGEFMTFLGPSGSGKTTTLNMIAGFCPIAEGEILLSGAPLKGMPPHKRDIGMVFQSYALFPHMTVEANIAFPLRRRGVKGADLSERVRDALRLVRLDGYGNRFPEQLSGGQQQRVALARAIVFNPRVLLMDEPLGALDKKLREWLQLEIKRIHEELGITFVYVTHDQEEALALSDRIAVFDHGEVQQVGKPDQLYDCPKSRFVAEFLGESNIFDGEVIAREGSNVELGTEHGALRAVSRIDLEGPAASICVRPERVRVLDEAEIGDSRLNRLVGAVRQIIYLGSTRKVEIETGEGFVLIVREQAGRLSGAGQPGDQVVVGWRPEDGVLVPQ